MKVEIKNNGSVIGEVPQKGEIWCVQKIGVPPYLILVVQVDYLFFNYIHLNESNRCAEPMPLDELYQYTINLGYTLTKFTGSVTISNE